MNGNKDWVAMSARTASNASTEISGQAASGNDAQATSSSIQ
jgi:hypothetical protein